MTAEQWTELGKVLGLALGGVWVSFQAASAKTKANAQESRLAMGNDAFRELRDAVTELKSRVDVLERSGKR